MFGVILSVAMLMGGGEDDKKPVTGEIETIQFMPNGDRPWFVKVTLKKDKADEVHNISGAKITLDGKKIKMNDFIKWLADHESPKVKIYFEGYLGSIDRVEVTSPPKDDK